MKDAQATGEAFSPQKRTSSTSKHDTYSFLLVQTQTAKTNATTLLYYKIVLHITG
jgi:hypothetical protein